MSLFNQAPVAGDSQNIQQNLFSQAIKETVNDTHFEYVEVNNDNKNEILEQLKKSERIALRFSRKDDKISKIAVSNGKNYCFSEGFIKDLKPIIEDENIKKIQYDAKSDYHLLNFNGFSFGF